MSSSLAEMLNQARRFHQSGAFSAAETLYREIIRLEPRNPDAHHLLGILANQTGRADIGIPLIRQAIALNPAVAAFHRNLGIAFVDKGQFAEAEGCFRQALRLGPNSAEAHKDLGNALFWHGRLTEAAECFRQALQLDPNHAGAYNDLGNTLLKQGQLTEAGTCFQQALRINPGVADVHCNLGNVFFEQRLLAEASACYREALRLDPRHANAHYNLGNVCARQGRPAEAAECFRQALATAPDHADAYQNLGQVLLRQGQPSAALSRFHQALRLKPNNEQAYIGLGHVYVNLGQLHEAIACFQKALDLKPDGAEAHSNLVYAVHFLPGQDGAALLAECRRWHQRHAEPLSQLIQPHPNDRSRQRRLRIGYVSPDFRWHPVGRFVLPLLENHDREQFEIFCYSSLEEEDSLTESCRRHADGWRPIFGVTDVQTADLIRRDKIDILVDLAMHTANNRLLVFARQPAPVQVTYLAYCGTTGLDAIDYRLTDPYLDPPGRHDRFYREQSIYLPETFWCYQPPTGVPNPDRAGGAEAAGLTFGCLNSFWKVTVPALEAWASLLQRVPGAGLVLSTHSGGHRDQVRDFFARRAISPERVRFLDKVPMIAYFAAYAQIDVVLDTFPYGGGTTTCDALWMGVPVVSLAGETAVGRGGVSILSNVGLADLVARSVAEYVDVAVALANDENRRSNLRLTLRERMRHSPLMDAPRFARNIEAAYRSMWGKWCEGRGEG